jgi:hypothetical protein
MKRAPTVPTGFCFLAALLCTQVLAGQFKTKIVDGVTVVTNGKRPQPPIGAATKLVLEEIYTAGGGDSVEASFVQPVALDIDKEGNAFVLDFKDNRVKVFDSKGKFLRGFGKKGQGPGELNMPGGIIISPLNEVIVEDTLNQRLAFFTRDGKFLRQISMTKALGLSAVQMDARGLIVGRSMGMAEGGKISMEVRTYDKDFQPKAKLASLEYAVTPRPKLNPFAAVALLYELDGRGNIFLAGPNGYEIRLVSSEGKLLRTIGRDFDPVPITKADRDKWLKADANVSGVNVNDMFQLPASFPPYYHFVLADEGRLLVRTFEEAKGKKGYYWDVFDAEGRYIAKVPILNDIAAWRDGRAYFLADDADGYRVLQCFRARWEK